MTTRCGVGIMGRRVWLGLLLAVAAACGGSATEPTDNERPVARVAADRTSVPRGDGFQTVVTLDASDSSDPDGDQLTYSWVVPNGRFENGTTSSDAVIEVTFPGTRPYTVRVTVSDGRGGSDTATITIGLS